MDSFGTALLNRFVIINLNMLPVGNWGINCVGIVMCILENIITESFLINNVFMENTNY